jgi:hypothetical protein
MSLNFLHCGSKEFEVIKVQICSLIRIFLEINLTNLRSHHNAVTFLRLFFMLMVYQRNVI